MYKSAEYGKHAKEATGVVHQYPWGYFRTAWKEPRGGDTGRGTLPPISSDFFLLSAHTHPITSTTPGMGPGDKALFTDDMYQFHWDNPQYILGRWRLWEYTKQNMDGRMIMDWPMLCKFCKAAEIWPDNLDCCEMAR